MRGFGLLRTGGGGGNGAVPLVPLAGIMVSGARPAMLILSAAPRTPAPFFPRARPFLVNENIPKTTTTKTTN